MGIGARLTWMIVSEFACANRLKMTSARDSNTHSSAGCSNGFGP